MTQLEQHTVHAYDRDLDAITDGILQMGELAQTMLSIVERSLTERSQALVSLAKDTDHEINQLDMEMEQQATSMLALRQPVGIDLRLVISALKSAVILERMGDLAKNTVRRSSSMTVPIPPASLDQIQRMIAIVASMLADTMEAFAHQNAEKIFSVCSKDAEVDALYYDLIAELESHIQTHPNATASHLQAIFAIKNIERFADYVTKLARMVYYIVSGKRAPSAKPVQ